MYRLLVKKGYRPKRDVLYVEEKNAGHNEAAWARRLAPAIRFLLDDNGKVIFDDHRVMTVARKLLDDTRRNGGDVRSQASRLDDM